jgi:hypothetical protein
LASSSANALLDAPPLLVGFLAALFLPRRGGRCSNVVCAALLWAIGFPCPVELACPAALLCPEEL